MLNVKFKGDLDFLYQLALAWVLIAVLGTYAVPQFYRKPGKYA